MVAKIVHELVCLIEERLGTEIIDEVRNKEKVKDVSIH
jgi:hypothetical protein